jgi:hypothetical protein
MALDFTVVIEVRQRFGDGDLSDNAGLETEAPFVGLQKDFEFRCPNVDSTQQAILFFQAQGANTRQRLEINGFEIFGGIPAGIDVAPQNILFAQWNGSVMLVSPGVLREKNVLHIQSTLSGEFGKADNFIVDNLVVLFKTKRTGPFDTGEVVKW